MTPQYVEFDCLEIEQPIGTFYVGVADAADVLAISFADIRRLVDRELELYIGIQRPLSDNRLREIKQYVSNVDASFPTGVILSLKSEFANYDATTKRLRIDKRADAALIIDGQHRIAGLEGFSGKFQLPIVCFVDMDTEDQALLFATINLKQTKVNKSLAYDLFEFSRSRSPQRSCHDIAKVLNGSPESPFYHLIKILGLATPGRYENLTQAAFVEKIMGFITDNPMRDRDTYRRGRVPALEFRGYEKRRYIFRELFLAERDKDILLTISNFFSCVSAKWPTAWKTPARGTMLGRTNGFFALCEFMRHLWVKSETTDVLTKETACQAIEAVDLKDEDFTTDRYQPGTSGQKALFDDLVRLSNGN